ncbi:MAG: hypothetical protein UW30_C0023G0012 [Candidatus Giovannonibacteria bacterium GW2011_GWA2_44_13b]|uniref:Uncharacterized protein n=1 Tax=Candidatus Giovannonibacteria bacterium GW2011_GWA2_44_13b TaxID=1618647 RepID=A0A0G1JXK3_9BACT|nr:MAG: hypothetical protein UW30_C0023G0012 [Candidatus Giovannonibacteria bacterium GW2011_GWA2_44_13b]
MLRKLGEKVGDFLFRLKKPKKDSLIPRRYKCFVKEGVQKEYAFRRALKLAREENLKK